MHYLAGAAFSVSVLELGSARPDFWRPLLESFWIRAKCLEGGFPGKGEVILQSGGIVGRSARR